MPETHLGEADHPLARDHADARPVSSLETRQLHAEFPSVLIKIAPLIGSPRAMPKSNIRSRGA
jgi:hypothetical protein